MKNPLKIVTRIGKVMSWLSLIFRILLAIKSVLNGPQGNDDDIKNNQVP